MRIVQVAPFVAPIDDRRDQIGGAQVVLADLTTALAERGHDVTLIAAEGSHVAGARIAPLGIDSRRLVAADLGDRDAPRSDDAAQREAFGLARAWIDASAAQIDVVHAHAYDAPAFDELRGGPVPVIHTLHLPPRDRAVVRAARDAKDAHLVTVSEANARAWRAAGVDVRRVIYNGIDVAAVPFAAARGEHLLYAGRLSPEKGVAVALDVAERLGRGILLVGGTYDETYAATIAHRVRHVSDIPTGPVRGASYLGPRPRAEVWQLMGSAAATLMPVLWDEPFGLVAVESLAAGTPVAAYRRGGLAEILSDSVGALVDPNGVESFARGTQRAIGLDPLACRLRAEVFALDRMVDAYVALYAELGGRSAPRG